MKNAIENKWFIKYFEKTIILSATLIALILCLYVAVKEPILPQVIEGYESQVEFELTGQLAESMDTSVGWAFFVAGTFEGEAVSGHFETADFDCPVTIKFQAIDHVLRYAISEDAMTHYAKDRSDKCVQHYVDTIIPKFSQEFNVKQKNRASYQSLTLKSETAENDDNGKMHQAIGSNKSEDDKESSQIKNYHCVEKRFIKKRKDGPAPPFPQFYEDKEICVTYELIDVEKTSDNVEKESLQK